MTTLSITDPTVKRSQLDERVKLERNYAKLSGYAFDYCVKEHLTRASVLIIMYDRDRPTHAKKVFVYPIIEDEYHDRLPSIDRHRRNDSAYLHGGWCRHWLNCLGP